ncbi:MAG TPA: hypothetical protein VF681_03400 [Abditibacteriaceae bacterium]|jgi:hypothetical protein
MKRDYGEAAPKPPGLTLEQMERRLKALERLLIRECEKLKRL